MKLCLIPILLLLALTLPHLEQGDFRRDTVRYAAVGHFMWSGGSLLTPYLTSEKPYFNKPPMALWIHGAFLKMFGVHLAAARIPSILAALGVLIFSMLALRNLAGDREALVSGVILATTYEFFRRTREISLDFWQLFFVMAAVWLVTRAIRGNRRGPLIVAGMPLGLALLCKPLVAFAVFPVLAIWLCMTGRRNLLGWLVLTFAVTLAVAAPWHLYMYAMFGDRFTGIYFGREVLERAQRTDQPSTPLYYIEQIATTYWPWLLAVGFGGYLAIANGRTRDHRPGTTVHNGDKVACVWVVLWLVGLSLFADRKPNYALPLYPMLSWIAAWAICRVPVFSFAEWLERNTRWVAAAIVVFFVIAAIAPIRFQQPPEKHSVALVEWLKKHTDVESVYYDRVEPQDVSYVYVKTGKWMKSLRDRENSNPPVPAPTDAKILTKAYGNKGPTEGVLFHSGPFYVTSTAP